MQITAQIKLVPTDEQRALILSTLREYIRCTNEIASQMFSIDDYGNFTSKNTVANLPSALKNQCCRDAKSVFRKYKKGLVEVLPRLKKPCAIWNNQNYTITEDSLSFPVWNTKSTKITVKALITDEAFKLLTTHKLGTLRITVKNNKIIAQIAYEKREPSIIEGQAMGVDLGLKCPAVSYTEDGKVQFFGNGRKNKFIRRKFYTKRKKLGKNKKLNAIKKANNKEQRIMKDMDHKLSREIVNYAKSNGVSLIKLEELNNIYSSTRKSRKNERNLHNWSFYRLAHFIEYKAKLEGIEVVFVNPAYTSQVCPICGTLNKATDRHYKCSCGFHSHRDIVGAMNICAN